MGRRAWLALAVGAALAPGAVSALELALGDVVSIEPAMGAVRFDANSGLPTEIPDMFGASDDARGVAVTPDPRAPERFLVWLAASDGSVLALDPGNGLVVATCGAGDAEDVEAVPGQPVLYSVGSSLLRYELAVQQSSIVCNVQPALVDVAAETGASGYRLALFTQGGALVRAAVLLDSTATIAIYTAASGDLTPLALGFPSPGLVLGLGYNRFGALYFTRFMLQGSPIPSCVDAGVFVYSQRTGVSLAAAGDLLTSCVGVLASDPSAVGTSLYVAHGGLGVTPQIVALEQGPSGLGQSLFANAQPTDLVVVAPEAAASWPASATLLALAVLRGAGVRRRRAPP